MLGGGGGAAAELCGAALVCGAELGGVLGFAGGWLAGLEALGAGGAGVSVAVGAVTAPAPAELDEALLLPSGPELLELVGGGSAVAVLLLGLFWVSPTNATTQRAASTTAASA